MRSVLVFVVLLTIVLPASAGITDACVRLLDDYWLQPGVSMLIEMRVCYPDSGRGECLSDVQVKFNHPIILYPETIGYSEIEAGRPSWDAYVEEGVYTGGRACWDDSNGAPGEVCPGESTAVWIGATVEATEQRPQSWPIDVHWELYGDQGGHVDGWHVIWTPVEETSWGYIKALYR